MSAITWREVNSSNVKWVGWPSKNDDLPRRMIVQFIDGSQYVYIGVSRQRAVAMTRAKSVGRYLNQKVKGHYHHRRLG